MRRVKVHLAELGGGVGMSYWGIPSFIPGKKTICRKKKKHGEYSPYNNEHILCSKGVIKIIFPNKIKNITG